MPDAIAALPPLRCGGIGAIPGSFLGSEACRLWHAAPWNLLGEMLECEAARVTGRHGAFLLADRVDE